MNINRKRALAGLAGIAFFGSVVASAASLGGLTSTDLGASDSVVASCDTDGIAVAYTTAYDATDARYEVTNVNLSGVAAACAGQDIKVTLADSTDASIGTANALSSGATQSLTVAAAPGAEAVANISVVISG